MSAVEAFLQKCVDDKLFPGASVGQITRTGERRTWSAGRHTYETTSAVTTSQTIFDVASLTKTFPTTTLALLLEREGAWKLSDRLLQWVPEWKGEPSLTLDDLVTFRPEFALTLSQEKHRSGPELLELVLAAPLASPIGTTGPIYSNTSSMLLTLAIEAVTGHTLPELTQQRLFRPLQLTKTSFTPLEVLPLEQIAPTENDPWRGKLVHGEVHDESAWQLQQSGWFPGSAGVFSCVDDLLTFLHWHLNSGLDARGWEQYSPQWMGAQVSNQAYGKTGFTGCAMLVDPEAKTGSVFLSNAVHPRRSAEKGILNTLRQRLFELLAMNRQQNP